MAHPDLQLSTTNHYYTARDRITNSLLLCWWYYSSDRMALLTIHLKIIVVIKLAGHMP